MTKIEDIELDYAENLDIFNDEPDKVRKVKHIIWNDLTLIERRIIILYAEMKCMRLVAETIGVSTSTICHTIVNIRKRVLSIMGETPKKRKAPVKTRKVQEETEANNTLTKGF